MAKIDREMESGTFTNDNDSPMEQSRRLNYAVASAPFAGRIGGNQEFVVSSRDDDAGDVLKKLPDAVIRSNE